MHSNPTNKNQNISTLTNASTQTLKEQYKRHKSPLLKIPKESKVRSGFKYAPREHVGPDGVESSVCLFVKGMKTG